VVYKKGDDGESLKFKKIVIQHHRQKHLEMNSHSASQDIPRLLKNSEVHCHVHKSPQMDPFLSQMNPVQMLTPY
jgi:hypothetical protein